MDPLADRILHALSRYPESAEIVLGGYFALQHYLPYRTTHDIDAWWKGGASPAAEARIRTVMDEIARQEGFELRVRSFGQTRSFELRREGRNVFSFQIAIRSVALDEPLPSPWPPIGIETLRDNVGSKMNALVQRGAPRDFLDLHRLVTSGATTVDECWRIWDKKNEGQNREQARQQALVHLTRLETRRPLETIRDLAQREEARTVRTWFHELFFKP